MKKFLSLLMITVCLSGLFACGGSSESSSSESDKESYIALTMSNYSYYLSIDDIKTDGGSMYAGGQKFYWQDRKLSIYGAVNGIYADCVLTFTYGDSNTQKTVNLNASGFATFEYRLSNSNVTAKVLSVTGKVYV